MTICKPVRDGLISVKEGILVIVAGFFISTFVFMASNRGKAHTLHTSSEEAVTAPLQFTEAGGVRNPPLLKTTGRIVSGYDCRGVWIDRTTLPKDRAGCQALCQRLSQWGINAIFPETFSRTVAVCYNSKVAPLDEGFNTGNDLLKILIEEAHRKNIEVHAWCWCMCAGTAWRPGKKVIPNSHWLATNLKGEMVSESGSFWLCPLSAGGNRYILDVFSELIQNYDLDGINMDYIRVEENGKKPFCMCSRCRESWFKWVDRSEKAVWPPPPRSDDYLRWKEGLLDMFMERVARRVRTLDRNVALSACVLPLREQAKRLEAQHWGAWFAEGYLDFACALTYTDRLYRIRKWNTHLANHQAKGVRIFPSVGLHLTRGNHDRGAALVNECLNANLGGVMLFSLRDVTDSSGKTIQRFVKNRKRNFLHTPKQ